MRKMQFTNYWQQFEHTGRVEDYLKRYAMGRELGTDDPMYQLGMTMIVTSSLPPLCRTSSADSSLPV